MSTSPGDKRAAVDDTRAVDKADDKAGKVVLAVGVEPRHLGGLAAEQRAPVFAAGLCHAADDLLGHFGRQPARGQVVEEEQRTGALHQDVVDAVVHQILAHGVMTSAT